MQPTSFFRSPQTVQAFGYTRQAVTPQQKSTNPVLFQGLLSAWFNKRQPKQPLPVEVHVLPPRSQQPSLDNRLLHKIATVIVGTFHSWKTPAEHAQRLKALQEKQGAVLFYALDSKQTLVGTAMLLPLALKIWAEVHNVAVLPGYRGRGVGKALMLAVMAYARQQGFQHLELNYDPQNKPAQALYNALGFKSIPTGRRQRARMQYRLSME